MFDKKDSNPLTETLNRVVMEREKAMAQEKAATQARTEQNEKMWFDVNLESPRVNAPIVNMGEKRTGPAMDSPIMDGGAYTWETPPDLYVTESQLKSAQINKSSSAASQFNQAKLFRNIDWLVDTTYNEKVNSSERHDKLIRLQRLAKNNPEIVELIELMKELGY